MSVLNRVAYFQDRRDEVPNQELARELAARRDLQGIQEIAENLRHEKPSIQSDCLKVLCEVGYLAPELIADYAGRFLRLLESKNNRMVWVTTIALATIAGLRPWEIWAHADDLIYAVERGSLITVVWGLRALAKVHSST